VSAPRYEAKTLSKQENAVSAFVRERIPTMIQHIDGALARIQLNQLNSLPLPEHSPDKCHIEVPLLAKSKFQTLSNEIERDTNESSTQKAPHLDRLFVVGSWKSRLVTC